MQLLKNTTEGKYSLVVIRFIDLKSVLRYVRKCG